MTVEVITPDELDAAETTSGIVQRLIYETEAAVMIQSYIVGGTTSGWHHHGDRHVYGYVIEGGGRIEYGPDGGESRECNAGEFFYISPGTVHRDITPNGTDTIVLMCYVGSGPIVVNVEDPDNA